MSAERILVVEDDKLVRSVLLSRLGAQGYRVTASETVSEALREARVNPPDLLILDLTLLETDPFSGLTDGLAMLAMLRREGAQAQLPVIIYSVDNSPATQARAKQLGVSAILQKGCPFQQLLDTVRDVLAGRRPTSPRTTDAAAPPGPP
jgi:CheY-like chemotaxis protein